MRELFRSYIPDTVTLDRAGRREVVRRAKTRFLGSPRDVMRVAAAAIAPEVILVVGMVWMISEVQTSPTADGFVVKLVILMAGVHVLQFLAVAAALHRWFRPHVLAVLREVGQPVCIRCGYRMDGALDVPDVRARCPECGAEQTPALRGTAL